MIQLKNKIGNDIPTIGLGTFPLQGNELAKTIVKSVKVGFRLIDTSDDYRGESGVGIALKELLDMGLRREEMFLQTKITSDDSYSDEPFKGIYFTPNSKFMQRHTVDEIVREKVAKSLREMNTDYIDSLLIHLPYPGYIVDIWKAMIELKKEGIVRYIGVSNFNERHIDKLISETGVTPEINELYVSPIGIKQDIVDYCNKHNILVMPYSPLMDVAHGKIPTEKLQPIMSKYKKSLAQVVLRWNVERGCLPLPKTKNPIRLAENFNIFDFSLTEDEVKLISSLNIDNQYLVESKMCPGL